MGSYTLASGNGNPSRIIKPVKVIMDRLARDSATGRILDGLNVKTIPATRVDGIDDLPCIWPTEVTDEESAFFGAKTDTGLSSNQVKTEVTLSLLLSLSREYGLFSTTYGQKPFGCIDWIERVKDSIELDDDANADLMLDGTCIEPMYTTVRETTITDLAWTILFEIEFIPLPIQRGTRHYGWDYSN